MQYEASDANDARGRLDKLPLMLTSRQAASLLNVSASSFDRMKAMGSLPRHVLIGPGNHRWNRDELLAWIAAGCPARAEWEARRKLAK
ncbi:MAG: hypothetical protein K2W96_06950 [Gemmataceae bacterium]|nr:hypothetical protein [Gemmataceae bacterium]